MPRSLRTYDHRLRDLARSTGDLERVAGRNPDFDDVNMYAQSWNRDGEGWSALHPVEQVSWYDWGCCRLRTKRRGSSRGRGGLLAERPVASTKPRPGASETRWTPSPLAHLLPEAVPTAS